MFLKQKNTCELLCGCYVPVSAKCLLNEQAPFHSVHIVNQEIC